MNNSRFNYYLIVNIITGEILDKFLFLNNAEQVLDELENCINAKGLFYIKWTHNPLVINF